jgi:hypothetical protein
VHIGGSDSLSAQVTDGSFAALVSQSSMQHAALPEALQQAVQAAAAGAGHTGKGPAGPQLPPDLQQLATTLSDAQAGIPRAAKPGDPLSNAFTGKALVDWIQQHSSSSSSPDGRQAAVKVAEQLLGANVITVVSQQQPSAAELVVADDTAHWYRLRVDAPRDLPWGAALNTGVLTGHA